MAEKIALVTGAGSGICKEVALVLAEEGAKIVPLDANHLTPPSGGDPGRQTTGVVS